MIKESREKSRLLIADDSKMNREILKEILGDEYIVTEAKDGTEAIELLKKEEDSFSALLLLFLKPDISYQEESVLLMVTRFLTASIVKAALL